MSTPINDDIPWRELGGHVSGELSGSDRARLDAWLARDPEHARLLGLLERVWVTAAEAPTPDAETAVRRLVERMAAERAARRVEPRFRWTAGANGGMARADGGTARRALLAAGIAALVVLGWWAGAHRGPARVATADSAIPVTEYATKRGQRLRLTLPDGSGVMLGPESVLRIAAGYGAGAREVELTGDGYFTVTHDAARPFRVRAANGVIRDLGTRFVVRARRGEPGVRVVVAEGSVALGRAASADSVVLSRADLGDITASGELSRQRGVALGPWLAWTEGRLVFAAAPLPAVLAELGRWYDVDVRIADPRLATRTLTTTLQDESAAEALEQIRASLGAKLTRDGRRFVLALP
jgi:transmembrane sensor